MYLQQIMPMTLDVTTRHVILKVKKAVPSITLIIEGQDDMVWNDYVHSCAPCHLPHIDGKSDPNLTIVPIDLRCILCGSIRDVTTMLICDQ